MACASNSSASEGQNDSEAASFQKEMSYTCFPVEICTIIFSGLFIRLTCFSRHVELESSRTKKKGFFYVEFCVEFPVNN